MSRFIEAAPVPPLGHPGSPYNPATEGVNTFSLAGQVPAKLIQIWIDQWPRHSGCKFRLFVSVLFVCLFCCLSQLMGF